MALDGAIAEKHTALNDAAISLQNAKHDLVQLGWVKELVENEAWEYDQPKWSLPDPPALMSAKAYNSLTSEIIDKVTVLNQRICVQFTCGAEIEAVMN